VGSQRYVLRKILQAVVTLLFVLAFNFYLFRIMPGDPIRLLARSQHLTRADIAQQISQLGLDKPLIEQTGIYLKETLMGHLGISLRSGASVTSLIAHRLWPTVLLVGLATLLSTVIGVLIGIKGGWKRGSAFDTTSLFGSLVLYAMPEGWLGMILLITFAGVLGWFPAGQYASAQSPAGLSHIVDVANHLFLPCLTLTLGYLGEYAIIMRSSLLEVMGEDFVTTARAKGVPDRLIRSRHAVPNAFLPTFTLIFYSFGFVLGGSVIIEWVFSWPGLGLLTFEAIGQKDYPVIQGTFLVFSGAVIFFNLLADMLYGYLDPRIREA
jgi:peptide/nickel transport system permease protein